MRAWMYRFSCLINNSGMVNVYVYKLARSYNFYYRQFDTIILIKVQFLKQLNHIYLNCFSQLKHQKWRFYCYYVYSLLLSPMQYRLLISKNGIYSKYGILYKIKYVSIIWNDISNIKKRNIWITNLVIPK